MDGKTKAMISTYRQCRICGKRTTDLRKTMSQKSGKAGEYEKHSTDR